LQDSAFDLSYLSISLRRCTKFTAADSWRFRKKLHIHEKFNQTVDIGHRPGA